MFPDVVVISPYSQKLHNGMNNAKNYPYWKEIVKGIHDMGMSVMQVGITGEPIINGIDIVYGDMVEFNKSFAELEKIVKTTRRWISVDNFFQHFCMTIGVPGIVIFGVSDPLIFGHKTNINLLKDRSYLRWNTFDTWQNEKYREEVFVKSDIVLSNI